jgi:hypothetical protein
VQRRLGHELLHRRVLAGVGSDGAGWRIIIVQSHADLSPARNVLMSSAHHRPSRAETFAAYDTA